ncbi:hypothetical protein BDZ97DRAFT_2079143 [Flammula alnicola]|nr:hypothetical protein BDZ97DRAFT_2079143 [Flammula alnicola]
MSDDSLFYDAELTPPPNLPTLEDRRIFNSRAPISTLDDDILSRIFMLNASLDFECIHCPSRTTRRTSQVFHKWRQFALRFPMIWASSLDFGDPLPWIEKVISRTGSASLAIILPSITRWKYWKMPSLHEAQTWSLLAVLDFSSHGIDITDGIFDLALPLINRSRILVIKPTRPQWEHLVPVLTRRLSNLQSFSLIRGFPGHLDVELPTTLFDGHAPQLRILHLKGFICQPKSLSFQHLTSLLVAGTFARMKSGAPRGLTAVAWLRALEGMPKLKNLELVYCVWETTSETLAPLPEKYIRLPQLESIKLQGNLTSCSVILAHLNFPWDCNIDIRCLNTAVNDHLHSMISTFDRILRSRSIDPVSRRKGISLLSMYPMELSLTNTHHHPSGNGIFSVIWSAESAVDFTDILLPFISLLQIAGSEANDFFLNLSDIQSPIIVGHLIDALLFFPKVETLRMTQTDTFGRLLPVLGTRITDSETGEQVILFPHLTEISFVYASFSNNPFMPFGGISSGSCVGDQRWEYQSVLLSSCNAKVFNNWLGR